VNVSLAMLAVGSGILACLAGRMSLTARDRNTRTVLIAVALCVASAGIVISVAAVRSANP
jgi:hypothetical protein